MKNEKGKFKLRYLVAGIVFLLFTISIFNGYTIVNSETIIYYILGLLYLLGLIIIASNDKVKHKVNTGMLLYELIIVTLYMIYLYVAQSINIYRYVVYLVVMLALLVNDTLYLKRNLKSNYTIQLLLLSMMMSCFLGEVAFLFTVVFSLFAIAMTNIISKIFHKNINSKNMPIGYFLCSINIVIVVMTNFFVLGGCNG